MSGEGRAWRVLSSDARPGGAVGAVSSNLRQSELHEIFTKVYTKVTYTSSFGVSVLGVPDLF